MKKEISQKLIYHLLVEEKHRRGVSCVKLLLSPHEIFGADLDFYKPFIISNMLLSILALTTFFG